MLKLKNIVIENNIISCNITPEDSKSSGTMQYDVENDKVLMFSFPEGYEWCEPYIAQATQFFRNSDKSKLPNEKVLIWF